MRTIVRVLVIGCVALVSVITGYTTAENNYNNGKWGFPTAMDVYQGKTTLQYTVINGEKVDSVVVFKK